MRDFLRDTFLQKTRDEWTTRLGALDLPFAPVQTLPEVLDDAHFRQRGSIVSDARGWDHIANPLRFADEPAAERFEVSALGEHAEEVLRSLGYSDSEIARLADRAVIA